MNRSAYRPVQIVGVLILVLIGILLPMTAPTASADDDSLSLTVSGPSYVTPGSNITYELTLTNHDSEPVTEITIWNPLPANTTYVSGGTLFEDDGGVAFFLDSLATNDSQTFTLVVQADSDVAIDSVIENLDIEIENFTIGADSFEATADNGVDTTVEAPGTLVAIYKDASGRPFDVLVDGFQFENYGNEAPRDYSDDLGADDLFDLFGPDACQSGDTAETCVLTGPAQKWMEGQIAGMDGGHCEGMAAVSLHIFDESGFKGEYTPADLQPGASATIDLSFPAETLENYIAYYFVTQGVDEYFENEIVAGPVEIVEILTEEFNQATPVAYTLGFYLLPDFEAGHAVTAYGVETVSDTESRILVYDNNYPRQRQYLVVDMEADTWRYETAAAPGQDSDIYIGAATSENLSIVPNQSRDLPPGQYFTCPFCNGETDGDGDGAHNALVIAKGGLGKDAPPIEQMITGTIRFEYAGEGAMLVVNDEDQATGFAFDTETFINEIPGAVVQHFKGGLGKKIPPLVDVPYVEADETLYSVFISGKTIDSIADGALTMTGQGYAMGLDAIQLEPDELLEVALSPDGDYIAFSASETVDAPAIYIAYDPVSDEDPSIIFEVDGVVLDAGEESSLTLDPDLERVYFDDSGGLGQAFDVAMTMIWPDGDVEEYIQLIEVPEGYTSAFVDFGAWDGLLDPSIYVDDVLQNPLANHRLELVRSIRRYDPSPKPHAPAGVNRIKATFRNVTEVVLTDLYFTVADLGAGNVLLNAVGGPTGSGAEILVPDSALGGDGLLDPNESFTIVFDVGLLTADSSNLTVDANGEPWDWLLDIEPAPSYEGSETSFVFPVDARGHERFWRLRQSRNHSD